MDKHDSCVICSATSLTETICLKEPIKSKPRLMMLHGVGQILVPVKSREALPIGTHSVLFTPCLATLLWNHSEFTNDSNGKEKEQSSHVPSLLLLFPESLAAGSNAMTFSLNDVGLNCSLKITEEEERFGNKSFSFKE